MIRSFVVVLRGKDYAEFSLRVQAKNTTHAKRVAREFFPKSQAFIVHADYERAIMA